jgi:hypothetical protein
MAYKQNPGRGPKMKTGSGIPSSLLMENPTDPKSKTKDAVPGKRIPEGVTFGKTKKSTDDFGATVYSTNYSKKGKSGPSGIDLGPDFKPTKEQTRIANEKAKKAKKDISGTVKNKIYLGKAAGVKAIKSKTDNSLASSGDYDSKSNPSNRWAHYGKSSDGSISGWATTSGKIKPDVSYTTEGATFKQRQFTNKEQLAYDTKYGLGRTKEGFRANPFIKGFDSAVEDALSSEGNRLLRINKKKQLRKALKK